MGAPSLDLVASPEDAMLRGAVRGICADFGPDYTRRITAAGEPPSELWDALASRGYLGVNVPEEYGGGGLGLAALAAVGEEVAAAGCSLLLIVVSPAIVGSILARHGTDEQKERWLPGIGAGTSKIAFAITEPDAGSNSHNISTAAGRSNGKWVLRGSKTFISGVEDAEGYARERIVWDAPIGAHQGVSHPLAAAKIELELARLMMEKAATLYDAGAPAGEASNVAKYAAAEAGIHCVDQAIQTHGGNGFALEYGLTDLYWGVRLVRTAPVSREMILNYVAEHSLGLPRSY